MIRYKSNLNLHNLKSIIKSKNMQSKDVAGLLKVRPETVSRWINGATMPALEQAEHLAEVLGVTVSDILFEQKGMKIAGTRDFHGNIIFFDNMQPIRYLPVPGLNVPDHRFCLEVVTHLQEDKHSYDTFSNKHIEERTIHPSCFTMRSIMKVSGGPKEYVGKTIMGVIFPMPIKEDGIERFTIKFCKNEIELLDVELEWATPMLSRFYNRNQSEIFDLVDHHNDI